MAMENYPVLSDFKPPLHTKYLLLHEKIGSLLRLGIGFKVMSIFGISFGPKPKTWFRS